MGRTVGCTKVRLDSNMRKKLFQWYVIERLPVIEISNRLGIHKRTLYAYLKRLGIKRKKSDGRRLTDRGYVEVLCPGHPNARRRGYLLEHRLVAEKELGRPLRSAERVHHINHKKTDNRPENLVVFRNEREHQIFHRKLEKKKELVLMQLDETTKEWLNSIEQDYGIDLFASINYHLSNTIKNFQVDRIKDKRAILNIALLLSQKYMHEQRQGDLLHCLQIEKESEVLRKIKRIIMIILFETAAVKAAKIS